MHLPVLVEEVIEMMKLSPEGAYLDATFGDGGHTDKMLDLGAGKVTGVDRDPSTIERYQRSGKHCQSTRLTLVGGTYVSALGEIREESLDGILVDLGVSTRQLLTAERGFSFGKSGPLDMRMGLGKTLKDKLDETNVRALAEAISINIGKKNATPIARRVLEAYRSSPNMTTLDLAKVCGSKVGKRHPATELFLALRMWVNDEISQIREGLPLMLSRLKVGGRLVVLTFHSTEDGEVKKIFRVLSGKCGCDLDPCLCEKRQLVQWVNKKPWVASREEMRSNPRARSAKLRCVEKLSHTE